VETVILTNQSLTDCGSDNGTKAQMGKAHRIGVRGLLSAGVEGDAKLYSRRM
jgi:hypothetical protein